MGRIVRSLFTLFVVAIAMLACASSAEAQRSDGIRYRYVTGEFRGGYAQATSNGPVITIDEGFCAALGEHGCSFLKKHERAHVALGHIYVNTPRARYERDADCWAAKLATKAEVRAIVSFHRSQNNYRDRYQGTGSARSSTHRKVCCEEVSSITKRICRASVSDARRLFDSRSGRDSVRKESSQQRRCNVKVRKGKNVLFVRHGSTDLLEQDAFQKWDTPLNARGEAQAKRVAQELREVPFEVIVSSPMARAFQTAMEIAKTKPSVIVESGYFHELLRPAAVRGLPHRDPKIKHIVDYVHENFGKAHIRKHSNEENFVDLRLRASKGLTYLETMREKDILVVTHGGILRTMFCVMIFGPNISYENYRYVSDFLVPKNTGISYFEYDWNDSRRWHLKTWDNHAHLADIVD